MTAAGSFSDDQLEQAIGRASAGAPFRIDAHEIVLRGICETCAT